VCRLLAPEARKRLIGNNVATMQGIPQRIQELQIKHFCKADPKYGQGGAEGLGLNIEQVMNEELATAGD